VLPPLDIIQTFTHLYQQRAAAGPYTYYEGNVIEGYVVEVAKTENFAEESIVYTGDPVKILGSFRSLIVATDKTTILTSMYGAVETNVTLTQPGTYYWRVSWLNDPSVKTSGYYLSSPVSRFIVDPNAGTAATASECTIPPANTTYAAGLSSTLLNNNICIGKFKMLVKEISEQSGAYKGYGIIRWKDIPLKVVFTNLKINAQWQVYDGIARGDKQLTAGLRQWLRDNTPDLFNGLITAGANATDRAGGSTAGSIVQQVLSISNLVAGQATLPYGVNLRINDLEGQDRNFILALVDAEFTAQKASVAALLDFDIPDLEKILELATAGVEIEPAGFAGDFTVFFPKDKDFVINPDVKLGFKGCTYVPGTNTTSPSFTNNGTYFRYKRGSGSTSAQWEAGLAVKLSIAAGNGKFLTEISEPRDNYVSFEASTIITSPMGFVLGFNVGDRFGFTDVPGLELTCNNLILDLTGATNNSILNKAKLESIMGTHYYYGEEPNLFKGIYLQQLSAKYTKVLGDVDIGLQDMLIDVSDPSFYGKLRAANLVALPKPWPFTVDTIGIEIQRTLTRAYIKGKLPLPIAPDDPLKYTCDVKRSAPEEGETEGAFGLRFNVVTDESLKADILFSELELQNSSVGVWIPFEGEDDIKFEADLSGNLKLKVVDNMPLNVNMPLYSFQHLKLCSQEFEGSTSIFNGKLYYSSSTPGGGGAGGSGARIDGTAAGETTSNSEGTAHGFGASFSKFGLLVEPPTGSGGIGAKLGIKFNLTLSIGPSGSSESEETQFGVSATSEIRIRGGELRYDNGFSFVPELSIGFGSEFGVSGQIGPVTIKEGSSLTIYKASEDPVFGDGLALELGVDIKLGKGTIGGSLAAKFGTVSSAGNSYKYFGLGIRVDLSAVPVMILPPFQLTGIGGGFAINMEKTGGPPVSPNAGMTFESFTCAKGDNLLGDLKPRLRNYFFYLEATGNIQSDKVFKACMKMEATISNGRLASLSIFAKGLFLPNGNTGIAEGVVAMVLTNTETEVVFTLSGLMKVNDPIPGRTEFSFCININAPHEGNDNSIWYAMFGKPGAPNIISFNQPIPPVTVTSNLRFYFLTGNDLGAANAFVPGKPIPDLINRAVGSNGNESRKEVVDNYFGSFQRTVESIIGSNSRVPGCSSAGGLAFGAELNMQLDVSFLFIYFNMKLLFGFDLALLNYEEGCLECDDPPIENPGMNNWYATGQLYAGMEGDLGLQVDLWFWSGRASLFRANLAAMITGGGPNPWWGKGGVWARGEVLGGLITVNTEFKFSFGQQCRPPVFSLDDIKVISEVLPAQNSNDNNVFTVPSAIFNNAVTATSFINRSVSASVPRTGLQNIHTYNVDYQEDNENWVHRRFCFALNRFEMLEKPKVGGTFQNFAGVQYTAGEGRAEISPDGLSAKLNMDGYTLMGQSAYRLMVEIEVLEQMENIWYGAINKSGNKERRYEEVGISSAYPFFTGNPPETISNQEIIYATPVPGQRNFHPADLSSGNWKVFFRNAVPSYLNSKPEWMQEAENDPRTDIRFNIEYKLRFMNEDGATEESICSSCNGGASQLTWSGPLPKNLTAGKIYHVEWIRKWKGANQASEYMLVSRAFMGFFTSSLLLRQNHGSGTDTASAVVRLNRSTASRMDDLPFGESIVFQYTFRVSQYPSFSEKLSAMSVTAERNGRKIIYKSQSPVPELLDDVEVGRYKVFSENDEVFPPLYSLSFLPDDNRSFNTWKSSVGVLSTPDGGMESLSKLYADGFYFMNSYLQSFGSGQGIQFNEHLYYNPPGIENNYLPVRANVFSDESRFQGVANRLPYFPSGAVRTSYSGLKSRLTQAEGYTGSLRIYNPNAQARGLTLSSPDRSGGALGRLTNPVVATGLNLGTFSAPPHFQITVEIQEVVDRDALLYKEILKKASTEVARISRSSNLQSNLDLINPNVDLFIQTTREHALDVLVPFAGIPLNLSDNGVDFAIRSYLKNPMAFSSFATNTATVFGGESPIYYKLYNFQYFPSIHPAVVFADFSGNFMTITKPYARMHHSLQVYKTIFNKANPNPNMINVYYQALGIETSDIFKNLDVLKFRIKTSAPETRNSFYLTDDMTVPRSGSLRSAGNVQFVKP